MLLPIGHTFGIPFLSMASGYKNKVDSSFNLCKIRTQILLRQWSVGKLHALSVTMGEK